MPNAMGIGRQTVDVDLNEAPRRDENDSFFCSDLLPPLEFAENGRRRMVWICPPAFGRRMGRMSCARIATGVYALLGISGQHVVEGDVRKYWQGAWSLWRWTDFYTALADNFELLRDVISCQAIQSSSDVFKADLRCTLFGPELFFASDNFTAVTCKPPRNRRGQHTNSDTGHNCAIC